MILDNMSKSVWRILHSLLFKEVSLSGIIEIITKSGQICLTVFCVSLNLSIIGHKDDKRNSKVTIGCKVFHC